MSYIDFKGFTKIYKKCTADKYSFLVNDTTLPSDSPLRFRKNILESFDDKITDEKIQYYINRETTKISALSSGKVNNTLHVKRY